MATRGSALLYRIDAQDRLRDLSASWDAFALENGAAGLAARRIEGRVIHEFFSGAGLIHVYKVLFERIRSRGESLAFDLRCDSPTLERRVALTMRRVKDDCLEFESRVVATRPRAPLTLLDARAARDERVLEICSYCKAVAVGDERWVSTEEGVRVLGLMHAERVPRLAHGICPDCHEDVLGAMLV